MKKKLVIKNARSLITAWDRYDYWNMKSIWMTYKKLKIWFLLIVLPTFKNVGQVERLNMIQKVIW